MGLFSRKPKADKAASDGQKTAALISGNGAFRWKVVGESHFISDLQVLARSGTAEEQGSGEVHKVAVLVPEPNNPYDKKAIAVLIEGRKVGHVPKEQTHLIHEVVESVREQGYKYPAVQAVICWNGDLGTAPIGVRYDFVYERQPMAAADRPPAGTLQGTARQLKRGSEIALIDVDEALVEKVRASTEKQPRIGHVAEVGMCLDRHDDIWAFLDGLPLGRLDPETASYYVNDFRKLKKKGQFGVTDAHIKWVGSKSSHAVSLPMGYEGIL